MCLYRIMDTEQRGLTYGVYIPAAPMRPCTFDERLPATLYQDSQHHAPAGNFNLGVVLFRLRPVPVGSIRIRNPSLLVAPFPLKT